MTVFSAGFKGLLVGALLALPVLCMAQAQTATSMGANSAQPLDPRAPLFKPTDIEADRANEARRNPVPVSPMQATPIGKEYKIGPNDLLEVEIFEVENLRRTVRVNGTGFVSLPLIGRVNISGLNQQEAETLVADKYREKYLQNPQVAIFIKEYTSDRFTIEGAVSKPGIFPVTGEITLLRALAMAGGFGPIANSSEVIIFRANEQKVRQFAVFDVEKIRAGKSDDPVIKGDDMIVVQRDRTRALLKDSVFRDVMDSINPFSIFTR